MDLMIADYRRIYLARHHSSTRAYAGVAEALGANPEDCLLVGDAR
jgi:FMN phosphatase YigB (HAD superfamily)